MHWAQQYIGKPWVVGARGPDAFDCFGLMWYDYHKRGIELPQFADFNDRDTKRTMVALSKEETGPDWTRVEQPFDGCAVGLSMHELFHHVGLFAAIDGGLVVHAMDKRNVIAQSLARLRSEGFRRIEFFKHRAWPT